MVHKIDGQPYVNRFVYLFIYSMVPSFTRSFVVLSIQEPFSVHLFQDNREQLCNILSQYVQKTYQTKKSKDDHLQTVFLRKSISNMADA